MTIRFSGGQYVTGTPLNVTQRVTSLVRDAKGPFVFAQSGSDSPKSTEAIFLDGKDAEAVKKEQGTEELTFAGLQNYVLRQFSASGASDDANSFVSPESNEEIRKSELPDIDLFA